MAGVATFIVVTVLFVWAAVALIGKPALFSAKDDPKLLKKINETRARQGREPL